MKKRKPHVQLTEEQYQECVRIYDDGISADRIARAVGVHWTTMVDNLRARGAKIRTKRFGEQNEGFYRGGSFVDKDAVSLVNQAIASGKLVRPNNCEKCGTANKLTKAGQSYIQAHHCDYNKPLEVMWLCKKCHHQWHVHNKAIPKRNENELAG